MTAPTHLPAADRPAVIDDDAFADQQFTHDHPSRRYHRRPDLDGAVWLIRRQGRAYFRTLAGAPVMRCADTDDALRVAWFEAAWPDLDPLTRNKLIEAARKAERGTKATRQASAAPGGQSRVAAGQMPSPLTDTDDMQNGESP
jgi:hypothetical protein